jgi:hypothetical protein
LIDALSSEEEAYKKSEAEIAVLKTRTQSTRGSTRTPAMSIPSNWGSGPLEGYLSLTSRPAGTLSQQFVYATVEYPEMRIGCIETTCLEHQ